MANTSLQMMRAARFHGPRKIFIEHIPVPPAPLPHEVTISPLWGGICGTDLHEYTSGPIATPPTAHPHPLTGDQIPVTLGHEFCGEVSALPQGYTGPLKLGMKVMVDPRLTCMECLPCRSGADNICKIYGFVGLSGSCGGGGGFSEQVNVSQRMCHVLPEHVNVNDAVLIEPLAVGRHALSASGITNWTGLDVLLLGGGPVGLAVLYNLRATGVKRVFVSEPTRKRREIITNLGLAQAEDVLDPLVQNIPEITRRETSGEGPDVVFDCAGVQAAMEAGIDALRRRGVHVNVAGWDKPFVLPLMLAITKEVTIKFSLAYDNEDFKAVVADFAAGKFVGCESMITARISLDDLVEKGFEEPDKNMDQHVKIVATSRRELLSA